MNASKVSKEQGGPRRKIRKNLEKCFKIKWGKGRKQVGGSRKDD